MKRRAAVCHYHHALNLGLAYDGAPGRDDARWHAHYAMLIVSRFEDALVDALADAERALHAADHGRRDEAHGILAGLVTDLRRALDPAAPSTTDELLDELAARARPAILLAGAAA